MIREAPETVQLRVPPLDTFPIRPVRPDLVQRLQAVAAAQGSFLATFGLELKAAALAARSGDAQDRRTFRRFVGRPAIEPTLLVAWRHLSDRDTTAVNLQEAASVLLGGKAEMASGQMRTTPAADGSTTYYAPVEERAQWESTLREGRRRAPCPVSRALFAYFVMILCHPLRDGNGPVGRGLILGSLCADNIVQGPQIPLGPAFYRGADLVAGTMQRLSETGDWESAITALARLLDFACDDGEAVAALL